MRKTCIIGISGQLNSGKNTVADHLVADYGFYNVAFADPIKRFGLRAFGFTERQLWGPSRFRNDPDQRFRAAQDPAWAAALQYVEDEGLAYCEDLVGAGKAKDAHKELIHWFFWLRSKYASNLSPRVMLQTLGTEWGRQSVEGNIWVDYTVRTAKTLLHEDGNTEGCTYDPQHGIVYTPDAESQVSGVVISDVRFLNEIQAIRQAGGTNVRVVRPETDGDAAHVGVEGHASETQDFSFDHFDFILNNDKSIGQLYEDLDRYMELFLAEHH